MGEAILRAWGGGSTPTLEMYAQRMPYPSYYEDDMITVIQTQLPLFLMLSFILTVIQTTKAIVLEKERRIKVLKTSILTTGKSEQTDKPYYLTVTVKCGTLY